MLFANKISFFSVGETFPILPVVVNDLKGLLNG